MARASFPHIRLHQDMPDHPKVEPLSDAAFRLLVTSWAWSRKHETDGVMPLAVWLKRKSTKVRAELTVVGLVHVQGDVVRFHDYLDWQSSADEMSAKREQRRSAGQAGGLAKAKRVAKQAASDSLSGGLPDLDVDVEKDKKDQAAAAADLPREDVEGLCSYFAAALARNGVTATVTAKWRTEARLLLDKNARPPAEIRAVIDWATQDSFWRANILSVPKLREQYDRLRLAMESRGGRRPVGTGIASHADDAYLEPGVFSDAMQRRIAREAGESA